VHCTGSPAPDLAVLQTLQRDLQPQFIFMHLTHNSSSSWFSNHLARAPLWLCTQTYDEHSQSPFLKIGLPLTSSSSPRLCLPALPFAWPKSASSNCSSRCCRCCCSCGDGCC